jgi:hypothetical protein
MMDHDAQTICGPRHGRGIFRRAHRWGKTKARSASTAAMLGSNDQRFAASRARSRLCRARRRQLQRTRSASGR